MHLNNLDNAINNFNEALKINPKHEDALKYKEKVEESLNNNNNSNSNKKKNRFVKEENKEDNKMF